MNPGIYPNMPMADYLAIKALSNTPLRAIVDECPRAAWFASHLNPNPVRKQSDAMSLGTVAHGLLLEGSLDKLVVIDPLDHPAEKTGNIPDGWTNKSIRAARDDAIAAGKCPLLPEAYEAVRSMVTVALDFIGALQHTEPAIWRAFQPGGGMSEVTMVWQEGADIGKLRTDRISGDYSVVVDYKTSAMSVEPDRWGRTQMANLGHDFGAAWYRRGIKAATGQDATYVYLCQEVESPFLCSLVGLDPARMAFGDEKVAAALKLWEQCVRTGQWDGYPNRVCYPEMNQWERNRWDEKQGIGADGIPYDIADLFKKKEA
jgi:hypothetical protein